ncbi:MAG: nitrilase-related carbon-nitrogen hydrolase, partial [bacterium]
LLPWSLHAPLPVITDGFMIGVMQVERWDREKLADLNRKALTKKKAQLVVWPELSGDIIANLGDTEPLRTLSSEPDQPPFITTFVDQALPLPHNAEALFDKGKQSQLYFKRKPFGGEKNVHAAGTNPLTVQGPIRIGLSTCFDSCYPSMMRETALLNDPQIIVVPSLDPPSTTGFIQAAHAAFTPFRASELGVHFARAEATGYSQIVDNQGEVMVMAPLGFEGVLVKPIRPGIRLTLYRYLGDFVIGLDLLLLVILVWVEKAVVKWRSNRYR